MQIISTVASTPDDAERLASESTIMHRGSAAGYGIIDDHTFYPLNHNQVRDLLGKLLTQLDAMGLPDRVHAANKALMMQAVWRWWDGVYSNATTSAVGCLAPVVTYNNGKYVEGEPSSNRWGFASEEEWRRSRGDHEVVYPAGNVVSGTAP